MSDPTTLMLGFLLMGAIAAVITLAIMYTREKNKKAATVAPGPSPSPGPPAGPAPAPDPQTVAGWSPAAANFMIFDTFTENPRINYTVKTCADVARSRGADAFTLRPSTHENKEYANTCMGYALMTPRFTDTMIGPTDGITGCVNPTKKWPACGTSNAWCHKVNLLTDMPYESDGTGQYTLAGAWGWPAGMDFKNLSSMKAAWAGGLKEYGSTGLSLKDRGYKYLAVTNVEGSNQTDSAYGVYYAFGKTLPNMDTLYLDEGCNYGGSTPTSSTKYKIGRKQGGFFYDATRKNPLDYHEGTTWRIYDLSQIV